MIPHACNRPREASARGRLLVSLERLTERGGRSSIRQSTWLWSRMLGVQIPSVTLSAIARTACVSRASGRIASLATLGRASSSIWQSNGLLIRRFRVRIPGGPLIYQREHVPPARRPGRCCHSCCHRAFPGQSRRPDPVHSSPPQPNFALTDFRHLVAKGFSQVVHRRKVCVRLHPGPTVTEDPARLRSPLDDAVVVGALGYTAGPVLIARPRHGAARRSFSSGACSFGVPRLARAYR
jgi:hypothetical protein